LKTGNAAAYNQCIDSNGTVGFHSFLPAELKATPKC
jgi:hypothetical protein